MSDQQPTPVQESINLISIGAILISAACYYVASVGTEIVTPLVLWLASLYPIRMPQLDLLIGSATVGGAFFIFGLAFASLLAKAFSSSQIAGLERQTLRLKRNRERYQDRKRSRDRFEVR